MSWLRRRRKEPRSKTAAKPDALIVMRLVDMHRNHPAQDNSHACSKCGSVVGIYPSGQRALRDNPGLPIICIRCATKEPPPDGMRPAGSIEEVIQEMRDSADVKRG